MNAERVLHTPVQFTLCQFDQSLPRKSLKRKFESFVSSVVRRELGYLSPPMSRPPSPPHSTIDPSSTRAESSSAAFEPVTAPLTTSSASELAATLPLVQQAATQPGTEGVSVQPPFIAFAPPPRPLGRPTGAGAPQTRDPGVLQVGSAFATDPLSTAASALRGPQSAVRTGRKAKAHVASACINCKRAHLSCDVQRPCVRCVASGKQDTCYDVQHKKRGRPRLREEGEYRGEQGPLEQGSGIAGSATTAAATSRPIAGARHRRRGSLRSLRSQTSDDPPASGGTGLSLPQESAQTIQSAFGFQRLQPPGRGLSVAEVPMGLLNLDFEFLRANASFQQILFGGQDIRRSRLGDIVAPANGESLQAIRDRLRAERVRREPAYMPPISHPGQDPLPEVSDTDVDRLTEGFADITYTWTRSPGGPGAERFPARVRLAKASTYFIVVTLPTFRPVAPYSSSSFPPGATPLPPPTTLPEWPSPARQWASQAAPSSAYYSLPAGGAPSPSQGRPTSQMYTPMQPMQYQPQQVQSPYPRVPPPATPRLSAAEPPTQATAFASWSAAREAMPSLGGAMQLPPMGTGGGPSEPRPTETPRRRESASEEEEEEEEGRQPKRRRMGIGDVLER